MENTGIKIETWSAYLENFGCLANNMITLFIWHLVIISRPNSDFVSKGTNWTSRFCLSPRNEEDVAMNGLVLLAFVGFVLAIGLALPYSNDEDQTIDDEMNEVPNDLTAENAKRYDENWLSYKTMSFLLSIIL